MDPCCIRKLVSSVESQRRKHCFNNRLAELGRHMRDDVRQRKARELVDQVLPTDQHVHADALRPRRGGQNRRIHRIGPQALLRSAYPTAVRRAKRTRAPTFWLPVTL